MLSKKRKREEGRRTGGKRGAAGKEKKKKKSSTAERGRKGRGRRRGKRRRKKERDLVRREKADTADVAGERNAAGISGRKLGGRVRRQGSGTKGALAHGTGRLKEGSGDRHGGDREGERCFRHLKPAVGGTDPL